MADSTDPRYDERTFALILRKAAELQARDASGAVPPGWSGREIEGIASEAGIEPRFVREAISAVSQQREGALARVFGYPFHIQAQQVVGAEIGDDTLSAIADALHTGFGRPGSAREVLGGMEWKARDQLGTMHASVRRTGSATRIQVGADRTEAAVVLGILTPIGGLIAGAIVASLFGPPTAANAAIAVGGGLAGFGAARIAWSRTARKWRSRVDEVLQRVLHTVRASNDRSGER